MSDSKLFRAISSYQISRGKLEREGAAEKAGFNAIEYMNALSGREDCLLHSYQVIKEKCQQINVMVTLLSDNITYTLYSRFC